MKEIRSLLEFDMEKGEEKGANSLINFKNAEFLSQNLKNPDEIATRFGLDSREKGAALATYYQGILHSLDQVTSDPEIDYYKSRFAALSIQKSIFVLYAYTFNNITSKAFADVYKQNNNRFQCNDYFNQFANGVIEKICNSNSLSLDSYEGIVTWTIAMYLYFDPEYLQKDSKDWDKYKEWDALKFISDQLDMTTENVLKFARTSYIQTVFDNIQVQFKNSFGCFEPPCNRKFLAEQQFYLGKITSCGLDTCKDYPSINKRSVYGFAENTGLLKNKIPEIYGFYNIHYNYQDIIFGGEADVIFSGNTGSIVNYYQMMLMKDLSKNERTSDLAHLFNIWSNPQYLVHYIDHLFFEWYLDGLIEEYN